jgi:hypothetical protein
MINPVDEDERPVSPCPVDDETSFRRNMTLVGFKPRYKSAI